MQQDLSHDRLAGGSRMGDDRRDVAYFCCIPEWRSDADRRQAGRFFSIMAVQAGSVAAWTSQA